MQIFFAKNVRTSFAKWELLLCTYCSDIYRFWESKELSISSDWATESVEELSLKCVRTFRFQNCRNNTKVRTDNFLRHSLFFEVWEIPRRKVGIGDIELWGFLFLVSNEFYCVDGSVFQEVANRQNRMEIWNLSPFIFSGYGATS
jgi:hypothetical protein